MFHIEIRLIQPHSQSRFNWIWHLGTIDADSELFPDGKIFLNYHTLAWFHSSLSS